MNRREIHRQSMNLRVAVKFDRVGWRGKKVAIEFAERESVVVVEVDPVALAHQLASKVARSPSRKSQVCSGAVRVRIVEDK